MGNATLSDSLESWKDIADYLQRDVRTVQRWEKTAGLPIHRVQESKSGSVFAYRSEIENWRHKRSVNIARDRLPVIPTEDKSTDPKAMVANKSRWHTLIVLFIGFSLGAACGLLVSHVLQTTALGQTRTASAKTHGARANIRPSVSERVGESAIKE